MYYNYMSHCKNESKLLEENGIQYTRHKETAEEMGYTEFFYNWSYFDQKKNVIVTGTAIVYIKWEEGKGLLALLNYWNARATNHKYWY